MKTLNRGLFKISFLIALAIAPFLAAGGSSLDNCENGFERHACGEEFERAAALDRKERPDPRNLSEEEWLSSNYDVNHFEVSHPGAYHKVLMVKENGRRIKLEDGSAWTVRSKDAVTTKYWKHSDSFELADTILIMQNKWYSDYPYRFVNMSTGDYVEVKPVEPSDDSGLYTYWITFIDRKNSQIQLSDGSWWDVYFFEFLSSSYWREGSLIVIGVNDAWNKTDNPHLLINLGKVDSFNPKNVVHARVRFKYKS